MKVRSADVPGLIGLRDTIIAIGVAFGGGALLVAAVMHLAAPVVVIRPAFAVETSAISAPNLAPSTRARPKLDRVIAQIPEASAKKSAGKARSARWEPRVVGTSIRGRAQPQPQPQTRMHTVIAKASAKAVATRAIARQARLQRGTTYQANVESRAIRVASRQSPVMPKRNAAATTATIANFGKPIARAHRSGVAKDVARRSARVAPTPEPPVGFDERPTLVEAPIAGQTTASMSASDAGLSGLRIRGRLLATPAPQATAKIVP